MLPAEWSEYVAKAEREISSRPSDAPKKPRALKKMVSPRQRKALSQQANTIKAMYGQESAWNATPVRDNTKGLTLNVGGNCEPDSPHGKATQSRS
jgi:hypothetical protein